MPSLYPHTQFVVKADCQFTFQFSYQSFLPLKCFTSFLKSQFSCSYFSSAGKLFYSSPPLQPQEFCRIIAHWPLPFSTCSCKHVIPQLSANWVEIVQRLPTCILGLWKHWKQNFYAMVVQCLQNLMDVLTELCLDFYLSSFLHPLPKTNQPNQRTLEKPHKQSNS